MCIVARVVEIEQYLITWCTQGSMLGPPGVPLEHANKGRTSVFSVN